jgi:hypothetical protein
MSPLPRHCRPLGEAFNRVDFQQRLLWVKNAKYSSGAVVFRSTPESGLKSDITP